MDDNLQQQADEIEALGAIYPTEFSIVESDKWADYQSQGDWSSKTLTQVVRVFIQPQEDEGNIHVSINLIAGMTDNYPTSDPPLVFIERVKGLSGEQGDELKALANKVAEENIGMPSIFMVATAIQEWLQENNTPGQDGSMYSDMMRRMQKKDVEEKKEQQKAAIRAFADSERSEDHVDLEEQERIRKRQAGVQVTVESFNAWKIKFEAEMALKNAGKNDSAADASKLSGKQWFLSQQASGNSGDNDNEEEKLIMEGEQEIPEESAEYGLGESDDEDDSDYVDSEGEDVSEDES